MFDGINYLAVIVATVVSFLLGWLWYSPVLFANAWMKEMGFTKESMDKAMKEGMAKQMMLGLVIAFITAFYLAHYIKGGMDMGDAIQWSAGLWAGIVVTTNAADYIWGKRSMKLFAINMGHHLAIFIAVAILLSLWK